MEDKKMGSFISDVLGNMPSDWLSLTTHRLDIYKESLAKVEFLDHLEALYKTNDMSPTVLSELPTAYDYIRLGHPLSCLLEWATAKSHGLHPDYVISFSSKTIPIMAVLRKNFLQNKNTQICYINELPEHFDVDVLRSVYGYQFDLEKVTDLTNMSVFEGSRILVSGLDEIRSFDLNSNIDFYVNAYADLGSVLLVNGHQNEGYISDIQHVRRRETIAMTPSNCLIALYAMIEQRSIEVEPSIVDTNKRLVLDSINEITGTDTKALLSSSGLSVQYAIMIGLVHHAQEHHKGKAIKFIVPPNCYGGTNDQARRVAACNENVEIVDLPVDGEHDMVHSMDVVLAEIASANAVPYIIAEIPTNPRVEVPELLDLKEVLSKERLTQSGEIAIDPVFILDQTFCPNVQFLGEHEILSTVRTIAYFSGSKFPSGGLCTAGFCVANRISESLIDKVELHLKLCDNEATSHQIQILTNQLPSMKQRIQDAYDHTRDFVSFIHETLPDAKINFVSEELASQGFTPSVFSLDLPTKGDTPEEREAYKRKLNHQLIHLMITKIPEESKHCVSYGQLQGCYWTIPATSTQGTTKEGDKDYIARVALSPNMDIELHKKVFLQFVESI